MTLYAVAYSYFYPNKSVFMYLCVGGDGKRMLSNEHLTLVVLHLVCVLLWWAAN